MYLFRRSLDLSQASVRPATEDDLTRIAQLLHHAERRYYGMLGNDMPRLLASVPAVVLQGPTELWGVAISGWRTNRVTWLRCLAFARGIAINDGMDTLLPPLHAALRNRGMQHIYYAGDETADAWLIPALTQQGYLPDTTVVVYEKHNLHIPTRGNGAAHIRPVQPSDLPALADLDSHCFEAHWTMNGAALGAAMAEEKSFFIVAQLDGPIVGYAYATSHFSGRLIHLVRIAVDPRQQSHGIGARLLAEVIAFARLNNADLITLNTQSYNERAQHLYEWFGFAPNGDYQTVLRYNLI